MTQIVSYINFHNFLSSSTSHGTLYELLIIFFFCFFPFPFFQFFFCATLPFLLIWMYAFKRALKWWSIVKKYEWAHPLFFPLIMKSEHICRSSMCYCFSAVLNTPMAVFHSSTHQIEICFALNIEIFYPICNINVSVGRLLVILE